MTWIGGQLKIGWHRAYSQQRTSQHSPHTGNGLIVSMQSLLHPAAEWAQLTTYKQLKHGPKWDGEGWLDNGSSWLKWFDYFLVCRRLSSEMKAGHPMIDLELDGATIMNSNQTESGSCKDELWMGGSHIDLTWLSEQKDRQHNFMWKVIVPRGSKTDRAVPPMHLKMSVSAGQVPTTMCDQPLDMKEWVNSESDCVCQREWISLFTDMRSPPVRAALVVCSFSESVDEGRLVKTAHLALKWIIQHQSEIITSIPALGSDKSW